MGTFHFRQKRNVFFTSFDFAYRVTNHLYSKKKIKIMCERNCLLWEKKLCDLGRKKNNCLRFGKEMLSSFDRQRANNISFCNVKYFDYIDIRISFLMQPLKTSTQLERKESFKKLKNCRRGVR